MVDQLLKYVEEQLAKGYKPENIKTTLIRQGYSPALVDGVVESVSRQPVTPPSAQTGVSHEKTAFSKIILVIGFLAIVVLGVVFLPGLLKPKQALLDVTATPDKLVYAPGERMGFTLEILNMGSKDTFDISLVYRILDKNDNLMLNQERSLAISTTNSQYISFDLPSTIKPGDYNLKVFANYGEGKVATSSFSFGIEEATVPVTPAAQSCKDKIKNQDELGPDCGGICGGYWYDGSCHSAPKPVSSLPSCNDGTQNQDEAGIDCGGVCGGYWYDNSCHSTPETAPPTLQPSFAKQMMEISQLAKTNPEGAKSKCLEFTKTEEKDICLKTVADKSSKSEYCELITDSTEKDNCYVPFFLNGDYSVCDKITDPDVKNSCDTLKEIDLIKQAQGQTG